MIRGDVGFKIAVASTRDDPTMLNGVQLFIMNERAWTTKTSSLRVGPKDPKSEVWDCFDSSTCIRRSLVNSCSSFSV